MFDVWIYWVVGVYIVLVMIVVGFMCVYVLNDGYFVYILCYYWYVFRDLYVVVGWDGMEFVIGRCIGFEVLNIYGWRVVVYLK